MNNKIITLMLIAMFSFALNSSQAQEPVKEAKKKVIIIKKVTGEDGEVKMEKTVKELDGEEVIIIERDGEVMDMKSSDDQKKKVIIKKIENGKEPVIIRWEGEGDIPDDIKIHMHQIGDHELLMLNNEELHEIKLDVDVIENAGKKKVIVKRLNDGEEPVIFEWEGEGELPAEIKSEAGNIFIIDNEAERTPKNNVLLGVVVKEEKDIEVENGKTVESPGVLLVQEIIEGSAAEEAGMLPGDILKSIENVEVTTLHGLLEELGENEAGDEVSIGYIRNGQSLKVTVSLQARPAEYAFDQDDHKDIHIKHRFHKDLEEGDQGKFHKEIIILNENEMDINLEDIEVEGLEEMVLEITRECEESGEPGIYIIKKRFNKEGEDLKVEVEVEVEVEETVAEEKLTSSTIVEPNIVKELPNRGLKVERFNAYPNPTDGLVSISFQAAPLPAVLRVFDLTGKVIFKENLNIFDGFYSKQLNVSNAAKGPLFVTLLQDGKTFTEQVIYQ